MVTNKSTAELFWAKVEKAEGCWSWRGYHNWKGYARFSVKGRGVPAGRYSWELVNGEWPEGMFACHTCDNPGCVNPAHIWPGTQAENMRDASQKGRKRLAPGTPRKPRMCPNCGHAVRRASYYAPTARRSGP